MNHLTKYLSAALSGALMFSVAGATHAVGAGGSTCYSVYAVTSVTQAKENETRGCGFESEGGPMGMKWSKDLDEHMAWCEEVPPNIWRGILERRQQMLESECKAS